MRRLQVFLAMVATVMSLSAQTTLLADFEDGTTGTLKINKDYTGALFSV